MNKKRKIIILTVIVVMISTIIIGSTLYDKSVRHEDVKQWIDNIPCDEFLSVDYDRNSEFNYLYEQKLKDCLEIQHVSMNIETVYVKILKGAVIDDNQMLEPEMITVQIGVNNTVTWINEDDTAHGITSNGGPDNAWGTLGVLHPGETYSHTFNESGIFPYHGEPNPWMTGFVIVLDSNPPQKHEEIGITDTDLIEIEKYQWDGTKQNDLACWTEWYIEKTTIDEEKLILSVEKTISGFGSQVDIPGREINVYQYDDETVVSIAGIWKDDQIQHGELISVIKNHIGNSKIIHDDIVLCN